MNIATHLRLALLSALACTAQPCATWVKQQWTPPLTDHAESSCVAIVGAEHTRLDWDEPDACDDNGMQCRVAAPELFAGVGAWVDGSIERWESIPTPKVLDLPGGVCAAGSCGELERMLVTEQDERE